MSHKPNTPAESPRVPARRGRTTRRGVRVAERAARVLISVAGIGTILAVATICLFLLWVVAPLFRTAEVEAARIVAPTATDEPALLRLEVDEYRSLIWLAFADGSIAAKRVDDATTLERVTPFGDARPTTAAFHGDLALFGFPDGGLRFARIRFDARALAESEITAEQRALAPGARTTIGNELFERTQQGDVRRQRLSVELEPAEAASNASAVLLVDHASAGGTRRCAALHADGSLLLHEWIEKTNLMTGETRLVGSEGRVPFSRIPGRGDPSHLVLAGGGTSLYLLWADGLTQRYDTRDLESLQLAEVVDVIEAPEGHLRAVSTLLGETSLVIGDDTGAASVWFPTKPDGASTSDRQVLTRVHELRGAAAPVTSIRASSRARMVAIGRENGAIEVFYATSARLLGSTGLPKNEPVTAVALAPIDDGLVALGPGGLWSADFDPRHPEAGLAAIFRPVWYEGYAAPEHVWQSSSGTDDFEPKLGLMPLVFGTLKATFYSLLFGVPLAILAAIYSSEFLNPKLRVPIKSSIEMMASLPSVVLGFLAAIILAPFVQSVVPTVIATFITIPFSLLCCAYLWQLVPARLALRWSDLQRLGLILLALPLGVGAAVLSAPRIEAWWFGGDFLRWLNGDGGSAFGGWLVLLLPVCVGVVVVVGGRVVGPRLRVISMDWSRASCARVDLLRFAVASVASFLLAAAVAAGLDSAGFDPRGSLIDTYVQRNALVVGFVMGFAIIPIVYTLAEDALNSVPGHLRLASLGCGATPWQTALRVIVPTAMSGLFSAVMIGLGRAVGETMIVLMAAGNTPVMDLNVFSGFRTLSANIATELPEAVADSTHYRMLFLAALTLFAITFLINTAAEVVRQRFRKRAFQL